ncbi:MAG: chemotaxis protein CheC [Planctomycetaceae bacterium]
MLSQQQLSALTILFRVGASDASVALARWLGRPAKISVEKIEQLELQDATNVLGTADAPVAACVMTMLGRVTGHLIMAFDNESGLCLADLLLSQPSGTAHEWGEVEKSAALETANIIGCAYLNALSRFFHDAEATHELVPTPPRFTQDYAQSILQFALMNQAIASDVVFLTRTEFRIDDAPVSWKLLFVPDSDCLPSLKEMLAV